MSLNLKKTRLIGDQQIPISRVKFYLYPTDPCGNRPAQIRGSNVSIAIAPYSFVISQSRRDVNLNHLKHDGQTSHPTMGIRVDLMRYGETLEIGEANSS